MVSSEALNEQNRNNGTPRKLKIMNKAGSEEVEFKN